MFLVDSHCHLDYEPMSTDIEGTLKRAVDKGINGFLTICTDLSKIPVMTSIAESHENVYATAGVHPHESQKAGTSAEIFKILTEVASHTKIVGFGETGLDYYYTHSPKSVQQESFASHIEAGIESNLPLIVHTRDAEEDTIHLIKTIGKGNSRGVIHCFSGSKWLRDQALELGFYISISGIITFNKASALREIVKDVPLEKLLVETDAPFLAPEPHRGKSNQPAYLVETAKKLAELKQVAYDELCHQTTQNFLSLFSKVKLSCV
ncbi:MAG: TatD family hydrolase [Proteobacteria bacterium]|nr:TatD family hydrolase [Pseudomonadota bacterium]